MERFTTLASVAAPLPQDDVDTDIIYPARFLLITDRAGLERYAFHDWRFDASGREKPGFPLGRTPWRGASILIAGANFGCGSSREHAPWALRALGIRCIVAPSFGEIFFNNCFKNGLLPIVSSAEDHAALLADAQAARVLVVDLRRCKIRRSDNSTIAFAVDPARRDALLNGWDEVETILARHSSDIDRFEAGQRQMQPWLWDKEMADALTDRA